MKKLFFSLVFFSLLLVVGCQENSVTDPVSPGEVQRANIPEVTSTTGTIPLDGIVKYPGPGNTYYTLKGSISYNLQLIPRESVPAAHTSLNSAEKTSTNEPISAAVPYYIRVAIYINATLNNSERTTVNTSYISSGSVSYLYKSVGGYYKLEKSYSFKGRNDNLSLMCRFLVTSHTIALDGRWLEFMVVTSGNSTR